MKVYCMEIEGAVRQKALSKKKAVLKKASLEKKGITCRILAVDLNIYRGKGVFVSGHLKPVGLTS